MKQKRIPHGGWTTAAVVAIALIVLYVISFGPVYWLTVDASAPRWIRPAGWYGYWPLFWLLRAGPQPARMLLWKYVELYRPS